MHRLRKALWSHGPPGHQRCDLVAVAVMKREFRAVGIGPYTAHLASEKLDDDEVELAAVVVRLRGQEQSVLPRRVEHHLRRGGRGRSHRGGLSQSAPAPGR